MKPVLLTALSLVSSLLLLGTTPAHADTGLAVEATSKAALALVEDLKPSTGKSRIDVATTCWSEWTQEVRFAVTDGVMLHDDSSSVHLQVRTKGPGAFLRIRYRF